MAISYVWDCKKHERYPSYGGKSNVVYRVHWTLTATDDSNTEKDVLGNDMQTQARAKGAQDLDISDLSSFKNWSTLTSSDLQGWVETAMGEDEVSALKSKLDGKIAEKNTPTSELKILAS